MKIESRDTTIRSLLKSSYYLIPRFQRPYSWRSENVEDLWEDAVRESQGDYFIGAMVAFPQTKDTYAVVDGQQRLTTIMLLLCALREAFREHDDLERAEGTQGFVERPDEDNQPQYVLQTETSHPYLQDRILSGDPGQLKNITPGSEEKALAAAYEQLARYIEQAAKSILESPTIPKAKKPDAVRTELKRIRDKVLDLQVILVEVDNQDNATLIFETLNARGQDLTVADLVKTHLLGYLKQRNKGLDAPRIKWDGIRAKFDASQVEIGLTPFLLAVWQSRYEYVNEKKLFKAVKATIKRKDAAQFLDLLVEEAELYRQLSEPGYRKWRPGKEAASAADSLRFLQDFRLRQPMPLLLSLLRDADSGSLKPKQLARALALIERFHFGFTVIAQKSSSGGWSFLYARLARELLGKPKDRKAEVVDELEDRYRDRYPDMAEFVGAFSELHFSDAFTQQKRTVQYVLKRMYEHGSKTANVDPSRMTIEHFAPQSDTSISRVGELGNLIWVPESLNLDLGAKTVAEKQAILRQAQGVWVPPDLLAARRWGDDAINARTLALAEAGYDDIWAIK
jgi:Protein of unknown function DUF262/Protein of unknown function (DUF1524)